MNIDSMVEMLQNKVGNSVDRAIENVESATSGRDACVIAKTYLTPQSYGARIENFVRNFANLERAKDKHAGDSFVIQNGVQKNIEIKTSIQAKNGGFNFIQLRPSHDVDIYVFLTYSITLDNTTWIVISEEDLIDILSEYGSYSHGTITKNGKIAETVRDKATHFEYSLNPNCHSRETLKPKKLWNALRKYEVKENELRSVLHAT